MAEFRFIGKEGAQKLHDFVHPIWSEVFGPMVTGGPAEAEYIFSRWLSAENIVKDMDSGMSYAYFAEGDRKLGFLAFRIEGERFFISKCYLSKNERGKGLGSEMLRMMLEYGKEHGCTSAYLHVNTNNAAAIKAYLRNGFSVDYHEIGDQGNGFATNDYVMSRSLGHPPVTSTESA